MARSGKYTGLGSTPSISLGLKLEMRLTTYSAAAGVAGLGLLASAPTAKARIVYTPAHQTISSNSSFALDLNHDGVTDVSIIDTYNCNFDYCFGRLSAIPVAGNGVEGRLGFLGTRIASALNPGARVGPARPFSGQLMASTNMGTNGQWLNVTDRYLGLKFQINGQTHFGWARLNVQVKSAHVGAVLTGYAYETVPNSPIVAGKTADGAEGTTANPDSVMREDSGLSASRTRPVPDPLSPSSLGVLALGAQGLPLWRQSKSGTA